MGKSTISMAIFNSKLLNYQRVPRKSSAGRRITSVLNWKNLPAIRRMFVACDASGCASGRGQIVYKMVHSECHWLVIIGNYTSGVIFFFLWAHSRETYQPASRMRWENGVFLMVHMVHEKKGRRPVRIFGDKQSQLWGTSVPVQSRPSSPLHRWAKSFSVSSFQF